MKKFLYTITIALSLTACINYDDATHETTARIQLAKPAEFTNGSDLAGHQIVIQQGTTRLTATTDAQGIATFSGLIPDVYDISTSWKMTAQEYANLTGEHVGNGKYTVAGSLHTQMLATEKTLTLSTNVTKDQSMLISKVYYAGSKDNNNKNYLA